MDADLDTLAAAVYVRTDDLLKAAPERAPWRPTIEITPKITDAELITLAVLQALLGHTSEARWLRYTRSHLRHLFPYLPKQPGRKGEPPRPGTEFFKPLRQVIESINDTLKSQLDLERQGGRTPAGVWHNDRTGQPVKRSLLAFDH